MGAEGAGGSKGRCDARQGSPDRRLRGEQETTGSGDPLGAKESRWVQERAGGSKERCDARRGSPDRRLRGEQATTGSGDPLGAGESRWEQGKV